jgi:hypothetical protein
MQKTILALMLTTAFAVPVAEAQFGDSLGLLHSTPYPYNLYQPVNIYSTDNFSTAGNGLMAVTFTVRNKDPERNAVIDASCDVYYDKNWRSLFQVFGWEEDGPVPMSTVSGTLKNQRDGHLAMWPGDNVAYLTFGKLNVPVDYVECRADKIIIEEPDMVHRFVKRIANAF